MPKNKTKKKKKKNTNPKKPKLNNQQEKFCRLYTTAREFFGNGVQSYIEAYDVDLSKRGAYQSARTCAWRLLTNVDILERINKLLDVVLNEAHVDKQLAFLITQNANFNAKIAAIKEYNALKKRVVTMHEVTGKGGGPVEVKVVHFNKKKKK
jgi:phage terminase small subunit